MVPTQNSGAIHNLQTAFGSLDQDLRQTAHGPRLHATHTCSCDTRTSKRVAADEDWLVYDTRLEERKNNIEHPSSGISLS